MPPEDRQPAFPSTRWSRILAPTGRRDLDGLAHAYARPIQAWFAARLRCRLEDAADAAQDAFAWLLRSGLFDKADPARGRFRGFLKRALGNFANEQWRRQRAQRRGGCVDLVPLDADGEPIDTKAPTPDEALDAAWRRELLTAAQDDLRRELEQKGHAVRWLLFRDHYLADGDEPDHATLAARHGITRTDVSNWLDHAKKRYRALLHERVADTVADADALQEELRWLFGAKATEGR